MSAQLVFDKKSYLIVYGISSEQVQKMEVLAKDLRFSILACESAVDAQSKVETMKHCIGIFLKPKDEADTQTLNGLIAFAQQNWIELRFISEGTDATEYIPRFLKEIFPDKFKELALFSLRSILEGMLPDLKLEWIEQDAPCQTEKKAHDFLVYCETNAPGFSGGVTLKSNYDFLRQHSLALREQDDEGVTRYFAEVGNQMLGLINYNLKKLNIEARIGLPVMIGKGGLAYYKRRSAFYMPSVTFTDPSGAVSLSVHFLVPFLSGAKFLHDFGFTVQVATEADALEVL